ncbi:MAG: thiazole synthase, partial [Planctomycetes bacterium]|nr:thiazole synthase [Planctomycetota bacterium]
MTTADPPLVLGPHTFTSRLFLGTGKYPSMESMVEALAASGTQCVTVAVRRMQIGAPQGKTLLDYLPRDRYVLLPNTAGCYDAEHAIRTARLGRELGIGDLVKLEVLGDPDTLLPDPVGTLEAAQALVKEGFTVLCYTSDDPVLGKRLEDAGVAAVMPAGAPIGSGQGILNPNNIRIILQRAKVPVIVDAGVGTASDVAP